MINNRLTFVVHELEDERTAYTTFEVLNSRGLEVSRVDRLEIGLVAKAFDKNSEASQELIEGCTKSG